MHFVKPRKGLFVVILVLLLASLACLGGSGDADSGDTGEANFEATQRSLESTQNALEVQQEAEPTQAAPQGEQESGPTNSGGSGNGPALSNTLFTHPEGIYDTYPPEGWEIEDYSGGAKFSAPDDSGFIEIFVTNTGTTLDSDGFTSFVTSYELNWYSTYEGYNEIERTIDADSGLAEVRKQITVDGSPVIINTFYDQHGQTVYILDLWAFSDVYEDFLTTYDNMFDVTTVYSDTAASQPVYYWTVTFTGPGSLFTMEVPAAFEYYVDEYTNEVWDKFVSNDGHMIIHSVVYNEGTTITKSLAGRVALDLLHSQYASDIRITDDEVQGDGSERLTWYSQSGGYAGLSFFEVRNNTSFLMLTYVYDDDYYDIYSPIIDYTLSTYTIP
ncbi:MAG: hypothetical protein JXB38_12360 [Anaerolineales bacterium]|nr:hypothetical protein [Anaerolineales bacterium]